MTNTYLVVPFAHKDRAKSLGARWDAGIRQWFVPAGLELAAFREWLPAENELQVAVVSSSTALITPGSESAVAQPRGVSLSQLLGGVAKAVADAYQQDVWTRVEVVNVSAKTGHVYLELSERDEEGRVLAKAHGAIWARTAERILPEFERATGAQLAPGIKLLVLAKPVFKAQYGFSLDITGIDPSYTIGDLEAQKRKIREQLKAEQLFERNKRLPAPWDFSLVLVVSPENAAGLGDFAAEAKRLHEHGVCEFMYAHGRFQGPGAAIEILAALQASLANAQGREFDAIIIIRGGGAVNDLAWLNDYELARFICTCHVPVFTGIGHERDSTLLDEVAHRCFDTPSKVIAGIEQQIAARARDAKGAYERILTSAARAAQRANIAAERLESETRASARGTVSDARRSTDSYMAQVQLAALSQVHEACMGSRDKMREVQDEARRHVRDAMHEVPAAMASIKELSAATLRATCGEVEALMPSVLDQVSAHSLRVRQGVQTTMGVLFERAQQAVRTARAGSDALVREVTGQGTKKTLARGFAIVRTESGKTVTSAEAATSAKELTVSFKDGAVRTTVRAQANEDSQGVSDGG